MWLPATPAYTVLISTPAMVWAASIASRIERTVHSMLLTTPLRRPRQGTLPTPRMVMPSASTSPTTAETFVVPRSSPTTISLEVREDFMILRKLRGQSGVSSRLGRRCHARFDKAKFRRLISCRLRSSAHPHDDAFRVRLVVEEHDARQAALFAQLAHDFFGHEQLLAPRARAELQRNAVFARGERDI